MKKAKLVGAGGYGGIGIVELLHRHPEVDLAALVDIAGTGRPLSDMWPHLAGACDMPVVPPDSREANVDCDVVIFATPDRVAQAAAPAEVEKGRRVVDFSGDFRSADEAAYADYAQRIGLDTGHLCPELLRESVYGVPELYRKEIAGARVVANPGCFAVSCILGLAPAVRENLIDTARIVCDSKTGISGAGKKPHAKFHYPEAYETSFAYRLAGHQHVMEVEAQMSILAEKEVEVTFTPQVVPMSRGILSTLYAPLAEGASQDKVLAAYRTAYEAEPFVRVYDASGPAGTGVVRESNFFVLTVACDERTGCFRVISHIDNLMKGQASNAVQNVNIMFGLDETLGLDQPGMHP